MIRNVHSEIEEAMSMPKQCSQFVYALRGFRGQEGTKQHQVAGLCTTLPRKEIIFGALKKQVKKQIYVFPEI